MSNLHRAEARAVEAAKELRRSRRKVHAALAREAILTELDRCSALYATKRERGEYVTDTDRAVARLLEEGIPVVEMGPILARALHLAAVPAPVDLWPVLMRLL